MIPYTPYTIEVSKIILLLPSFRHSNCKIERQGQFFVPQLEYPFSTLQEAESNEIHHLCTSHIHGDRFWFQFRNVAGKQKSKKSNNNNPS